MSLDSSLIQALITSSTTTADPSHQVDLLEGYFSLSLSSAKLRVAVKNTQWKDKRFIGELASIACTIVQCVAKLPQVLQSSQVI